jgi:hypothetical protein
MMDWILATDSKPETGKIVKILCLLETTGTFDPKDGMDWHQLPDADVKAEVTHWKEATDDK